MSTSGGFNPASEPPCPYPTYMTHAQAVALRDANGLDPRCQIVITDGPVIGTPGNTSPTQIELNPVGPGDIGRTARVHTNFDNVAFSSSSYNIDDGPNGTLNQLTDHWGNDIADEDPGAPTVHAMVPYHLSGPNLRDNTVNDCSLPGWAAAVAGGSVITDNELQEASVDLTGKTSGTFQRNNLNQSNLTANTSASFINNNSLTGAAVSHVGAGAGSFSFQNNTMLTGIVSVDAATTAQVTMNNNVIGGTAGGYRVQVVGKTAQPVIISGNRLFNVGLSAYEMRAAGSGLVSFTASTIGAGTITLDGPGDVDVTGLTASGTTVTSGPGDLGIQGVQATGGTLDHLGSGVMALLNSTLDACVITTTVPSTRGLGLSAFAGIAATITQSGTGSANADTFTDGTTFTKGSSALSAIGAGTPSSTFQGIQLTTGGQLNVGDHTSPEPVTRSRIDSNAILNLSGAGSFTNCRIASSPVLTLSGAATDSVIEGPINKTVASANSFKLASKAFDDWTL